LKTIRVESLFDQGTTRIVEDAMIVSFPSYFGVFDGVSAPHDEIENPPLTYPGGITGGQMAVKEMQSAFAAADSTTPMDDILMSANRRIMANHFFCHGILPRETEKMGGTAFVAAKLEKDKVSIIQGGDCFALLKTEHDGFRVTRNQVYGHDVVLRERINDLREKYGDDKVVWHGLRPLMIELRKAHANQLVEDGYAVLNGQPQVAECWNAFETPADGLQYLLLFSDGFVPFEKTRGEEILGKWVIDIYEKEGLLGVLRETRKEKKSAKQANNAYFAEATAMAVTFFA